MARGVQSYPSQPKKEPPPVTSIRDCPHCGSLCLGARVLPCGNVLCRRCLHDALQFPAAGCPQCKQPLRQPEDQALTISQVIQRMSSDPVIEHTVLQQLKRDKDTRCLICPDKKASYVCLDCQDYYCQACSSVHLRGRSCKEHLLHLLPAQALPNTSSPTKACAASCPAISPVLSASSADCFRVPDGHQSHGVSRDKSRGVKEWEEWVKKEEGESREVLTADWELETTLQSIVSLGQRLIGRLQKPRQVLNTYQRLIPRLNVTLSAGPGSYVAQIEGYDVSVDVKTSSLERRLCDVRKGHRRADINALKMIRAQLTQMLHSSVDVLTATPQTVFMSPTRSAQDRWSPFIAAIVCLPDDRLVMSDSNNQKVKVMDVSPPHNVLASQKIPETPLRLALLSDGLVAATTEKPLIYLMKVTNAVMATSLINTCRQYDGIAGHSAGLLIVSCGKSLIGPAVVDIVSRRGQVVKTLTDTWSALGAPHYLYRSDDRHILLSDCQRNVVHKINIHSGQTTQTYSHTHMKHPRQVCVDRYGNMFVSCCRTKCVMMRNSRGLWRRLLTTPQHSDSETAFPRGLCLTRSGHLVVSLGGPVAATDNVMCCKFR
ncbi:hypothetical protein ACOMHN_021785 [Nucella lapillus]